MIPTRPTLLDAVEEAAALGEEWNESDGLLFSVSLDDDVDRLLWPLAHRARELVEGLYLVAVDAQHAVARLENPVGGAIGKHRSRSPPGSSGCRP